MTDEPRRDGPPAVGDAEPTGSAPSLPDGGQSTAGTDPIRPDQKGADHVGPGPLGGSSGAGDYGGGSGGAGEDLSGTHEGGGSVAKPDRLPGDDDPYRPTGGRGATTGSSDGGVDGGPGGGSAASGS